MLIIKGDYDIDYQLNNKEPMCRVCDNPIQNGEIRLHTYSHRCRGMHVYICDSCLDKISTKYREVTNDS